MTDSASNLPSKPASAAASLSGSASSDLTVPNAENAYTVTVDDLPLHCPLPGTSLWNSHPRVYLPIEDTGSAKCSYCGAVFTLDK